ncbi:hypothetical protein [Xanthomonas sp. LF06-19]|uniref:hypothetical protein n=1 Tax=Xanthomonas sp. LF06-19 TaxID=3097551 RepID=UPI002A8139DB|nr:hypothetical protein [Xanthomonas sp. LF06-19]MDY4284351.1 hypothetical protein [Xanthomonas sp. LF06-19]
METAIVAGLFSLLGALLGAFLSRKGERGRWIRERRALAAEKFLATLSECSKVHYHQKHANRTEQALAVATTFLPAEDYARVVRLYLPDAKREKFSILTNKIVTLHISLGANAALLSDLNKAMDQLQELFEESLTTPY